jgi:hypothetical protein
MSIRRSEKTLTLKRPFVRGGIAEAPPAGAQSIPTVDERLEPTSSHAYRRVVTLTREHEIPVAKGTTRRESIGSDLLQLALIIGAATLVGIYLC